MKIKITGLANKMLLPRPNPEREVYVTVASFNIRLAVMDACSKQY